MTHAQGTAARRCARCTLPESYPGIRFDSAGICSICQAAPSPAEMAEQRKALGKRLQEICEQHRGSAGDYDCIVALSGGKDSSYTLAMLVRDRGLRCLAVTIDNGFLSDQAIENCRTICTALGVDHVFFKPAFGFMRQMYRESLKGGAHTPGAIKRASDVCNSCINLINTHVLKVAFSHGVGLVAGGYLGGQVPADSGIMTVSLEQHRKARSSQLSRYIERFGPDAERFFSLPKAKSGRNHPETVHVINPLLASDYDGERLIDFLKELGWRRPADTGMHSSNCRLNDLGISSHLKRYGFHPYETETANLVRSGLMNRDEAVSKLESKPTQATLAPLLRQLGLDAADV